MQVVTRENGQGGGTVSKVGNWVKSKDWFGHSFSMKLDKDENAVRSIIGSICSLALFIVVVLYTILKYDIMESKKGNIVVETVHDSYYDENYVLDFSEGFNIAVAFSAYDSE